MLVKVLADSITLTGSSLLDAREQKSAINYGDRLAVLNAQLLLPPTDRIVV